MKLLFKQRLFSWTDSYNIFNEAGETVYTVKAALAFGHCLEIFDANDNYIGKIQEKLLTFLPKFEMYLGNDYLGCIKKEFSFFRPKFNIDCNGWHVEGDYFEWDYHIIDSTGRFVATVSKELLNWTDTYSIEVEKPDDALCALMLVLAIDAEKCSRR